MRDHEKRATLNQCIERDERGLIDRAAELTGQTRNDCVLGAARRAVVEALTDRTLYLAGPETFASQSA